MSELTITKANFEQEVLNSDKPVLLDFWAPWCMPCRMIAPIVEEIAEDTAGKAVVGKVNVDEEGELAMKFGVASIPTLIVFKGGQEVKRVVGVQSKAALLALLD
ncbi:MAG: thioredoxin [Clostridia bacterium]|nr:thioredoxin [Clostridia bacterium]